MRLVLYSLFAVTLFFLQASDVGGQPNARSIIDKAIRAQGGEKKVARLKIMRIKVSGKGSFVAGRGETQFTLEDTWRMPDLYKTVMQMELGGKTFVQTQVVSGERGWISINGQTQPLTNEALVEIKEQKYAEDLDRLLSLEEKKYQLSIVDTIVVDGRRAVGIRVQSTGHRDVVLYFDKGSGLLVKRQQLIAGRQKMLTVQEVFFKDYKEIEGVKHWTTIEARHDGKKFLEGKVVTLEFLSSLDENQFAQP
jgi:hypothetical protein